MNTWRMAWRNIWRAKRRSLVTMAATAFALGTMIFFAGWTTGFSTQIRDSAVLMTMGHIQIHHPEFRDSYSIYKFIPDFESKIKALKEAQFKISYRLYANGLAAFEKSSAGVQICGVDADLEKQTIQLPNHLLKGNWLDRTDKDGVVLGRYLSETLNVKTGDTIVLVSQAADGSMANNLYAVRGILKNVSEDIDRAGLFMNTDTFREFMSFPDGVHEIIVSYEGDRDLNAAAKQVADIVPDMEVKTWRQISPELSDLSNYTETMLIPFLVIFYTAVAILILNAMLMAVYERIREFGIMKAIGMQPLRVFSVLAAESLFMTTIGTIIGAAFGLAVALHFQKVGIDFTRFSDSITLSGVAFENIWKVKVTVQSVVTPILMLFVMSAVATIYPAIKASVLSPVRAMRHL